MIQTRNVRMATCSVTISIRSVSYSAHAINTFLERKRNKRSALCSASSVFATLFTAADLGEEHADGLLRGVRCCRCTLRNILPNIFLLVHLGRVMNSLRLCHFVVFFFAVLGP